jgi:hypothetical protein
LTDQNFPPMHPITRLGRVIQQLKSFGDMHATELESMALDLEAAGAADVAAHLRMYRDVQRDEGQIVIDELVDVKTDMAATQPQDVPTEPPLAAAPGHDPAINSPRRARWLAEQAAEAERLKQPLSRRDLFGRATPKPHERV